MGFRKSVAKPSLLYFVDNVNEQTNHKQVMRILSKQERVLIFDVKKTTHRYFFKVNKFLWTIKDTLILIKIY
jgi:hypothetical protein